MKSTDRSALILASSAWEEYMRAYITLMRKFQLDGTFEDVSIKEYDVLYTLSKAPDPLSQTELVDSVLLSQPALSRLLGRLIQKGWITSEKHFSDGRALVYWLTEAGRRTQRAVGQVHGKAVASALYAALSEDEVRLLRDLARRLGEGTGEETEGRERTK